MDQMESLDGLKAETESAAESGTQDCLGVSLSCPGLSWWVPQLGKKGNAHLEDIHSW